jgi:hypothetical protein
MLALLLNPSINRASVRMYTTSLFIAALASIAVAAPSIAVAAPMTESDTNVFFTMISTHSGDPNVHLRSIAANGQRFWLGKDTTTYCPVDNAGVTCSYYSPAPSPSLSAHLLTYTPRQCHHRHRRQPQRQRHLRHGRRIAWRPTGLCSNRRPARVHASTQLPGAGGSAAGALLLYTPIIPRHGRQFRVQRERLRGVPGRGCGRVPDLCAGGAGVCEDGLYWDQCGDVGVYRGASVAVSVGRGLVYRRKADGVMRESDVSSIRVI